MTHEQLFIDRSAFWMPLDGKMTVANEDALKLLAAPENKGSSAVFARCILDAIDITRMTAAADA